jgi:hypothetical protein
MRPVRLKQMRGLRPVFAVLAIYALILQAVFATAAMGALPLGAASQGIAICRGDSGHADTGQGGTGQGHGESCACQGLCAQHGGAGIDPAAHLARWISPDRIGQKLVPAQTRSGPRSERRCGGFARAPPAMASDGATEPSEAEPIPL